MIGCRVVAAQRLITGSGVVQGDCLSEGRIHLTSQSNQFLHSLRCGLESSAHRLVRRQRVQTADVKPDVAGILRDSQRLPQVSLGRLRVAHGGQREPQRDLGPGDSDRIPRVRQRYRLLVKPHGVGRAESVAQPRMQRTRYLDDEVRAVVLDTRREREHVVPLVGKPLACCSRLPGRHPRLEGAVRATLPCVQTGVGAPRCLHEVVSQPVDGFPAV